MPLIQTPSIASVVEDQTPQLGGSLSTNGSNINVESGDVFYVHNLGTEGDSNYERLEVKWDASNLVFGTTSAGTGARQQILIQENGTTCLAFSNAETVSHRSFFPNSDSVRFLGLTGNRWLNTYTDTITIGNGVDAVLTADADLQH
jgi:hypothetical protein